jgi:lathosterol oxidase
MTRRQRCHLQNLTELQIYLHHLAEWKIFLSVTTGFGLAYIMLASFMTFLTEFMLLKIGIGERINKQVIKRNQIVKEIKRSFYSIMIFGCYGVITFDMIQCGWLKINWFFSWEKLLIDLLLLFFWNELHFYSCHRILHLRWFYQHVHVHHHRSVIPTPFSTYSFHWIEAILLSSVMVSCMFFYTLSFPSIIVFPLLSLILNNIGHMNYTLSKSSKRHILSSCKRHTVHHNKGNVNFGFFLPWLDQLFKTSSKAQ